MKTLYMRFIATMMLIVMCSSFAAIVLAFLCVHLFQLELERDIILAARIRDLLVPVLTVISAAIIIPSASKRTAAPIVALSNAAKLIAKGDLDISVQESKREDELGNLARDFNLMVKELRSNELMRKDFIANISHEFKTPLSIIQGYAKLLAGDTASDEERKQFALTIQNESERLIRLASNILRLSRLNSQAMQTNKTHFKLDEQLRQAVLFLEPTWAERGISFEIALNDHPYYGDEELLSQVWLNVIENAVKFSDDGDTIHIRSKGTASDIQIEVTDHGAGMDEATRERIFEQFFQGEASRSVDGSGLGLAIVKRIVELHGGHINVQSSPGKGTKVIVQLPFADDKSTSNISI